MASLSGTSIKEAKMHIPAIFQYRASSPPPTVALHNNPEESKSRLLSHSLRHSPPKRFEHVIGRKIKNSN
ncbi:hypothetical protein DSUL_60205 [Desulfovibrionales bacterium]